MKRIAILATLLASISSVAFAQPNPYRRDNDYDRRVDESARESYERYDRSHWARDFRGRWVTIAERRSAQSNQQIVLGRHARFSRLRIEGARGAPVIQKVTIEYMNGTPQIVPVNSRLVRGAGEVIRVNPDQAIKRVIVYAEPGYWGSYNVYAG